MKNRSFSVFLSLTKRHLLVFFANRVRLLYTLLVPVIIFGVYLLFLRALEIETVENSLLKLGIFLDGGLRVKIESLIDSWMIGGILSISTITVSLQTNTVIVEDKQNGVNRDFASSPVSKTLLVSSYFLYNFLVTAMICLVFYAICLIYLWSFQEFLLSFSGFLLTLAILLFSILVSTLITVFLCSFIKTEATMMSVVAVFSTAVGFLIGAYMPFGMLPEKMSFLKEICGFLPNTYACALLRFSLLKAPAMEALAAFSEIGLEEEALTLLHNFGYELTFFGHTIGPALQAVALAISSIVFSGLNIGFCGKLAQVLGTKRRKRRK